MSCLKHQLLAPSGPCFDCYAIVCCFCGGEIAGGDLYIEVRQRDLIDADAKYVTHLVCLLTLSQETEARVRKAGIAANVVAQ